MKGSGTDQLLQGLSGEAAFDSQGEFEIDVARAREKLEQHLGLWPEDYLAFLIQGAYARGATRLRLSSSWHSVIWDFDGKALSPEEMDNLAGRGEGHLSPSLQRLSLALFLLTRSRYSRVTLSSGGQALDWRLSRSNSLVRAAPRSEAAVRLELFLPLAHINMHWLLSRSSRLSTLPEYAAVRTRFKGGPLWLQLPWSSTGQPQDPLPLALCYRGRQRLPAACPVPVAEVVEVEGNRDFSFWYGVSRRSASQAFVLSLGYSVEAGPGLLWLYCDSLRTDLSQKQLVVGPRLQAVLQEVEQELVGQLSALWQDENRRRRCLPFLLDLLGSWAKGLNNLGESLRQVPFFRTAFHGSLSVAELDRHFLDQGRVLYYCTHPPRRNPAGAPPVVFLEPEVATILQSRYSDMRPCQEMLEQLERREENHSHWAGRQPESLELTGAHGVCNLADILPGWSGQIGWIPSPVPPRLDLFLEGRWVNSLDPGGRFPQGLVGRISHPQVQLNETWSSPTGSLWNEFLEWLWEWLPGWLASLWGESPEAWLRTRASELLLTHSASLPLESLPLLARGEDWVSLEDCRRALREETIEAWVFQGWKPQERRWAWLSRALPDEEERNDWRVRLEHFLVEYERWRQGPQRTVGLDPYMALACRIPLAHGLGEIGLRPPPLTGVVVLGFRQGRRLANHVLAARPKALGGLPDGLAAAVDHPELLPNCRWTELDPRGEAWSEIFTALTEAVPRLLAPLLEGTHPDRDVLALRILGWMPRSEWGDLSALGPLCYRLDGQPVSLAQAVRCLESGPPVRVLVEAQEVHLLENFAAVWRIGQALAYEISSQFGPSRLLDVQTEFRSAWLDQQRSQGNIEDPALQGEDWLVLRELPGTGQLGLRRQPGPANRVRLRLLRRGQRMWEETIPLTRDSFGEQQSRFCLEAVVDWGDLPYLANLEALRQDPLGGPKCKELWLELRALGFFEPRAEREFLWERLAYEEGSGSEPDPLRQNLRELPLFALDGRLWSLAEVQRYLAQEGRLGYVLGKGEELPGPVLSVTSQEAFWLKLLFGQQRLANLSHLRQAFRQKEQRSSEAPLRELPLPDLDYLIQDRQGDRCWGLRRELNGTSRVLFLRQMRIIEAMSFDWRYQVEACLLADDLQLNQDGTVRRDQVFHQRVEALREEIQTALVAQAPADYRVELALLGWGVQEPWARELQQQPLLRDPRGASFSLQDWVTRWEAEGRLPFLHDDQDWQEERELLPSRPVPVLKREWVALASRTLKGLQDYREGLRQAYQLSYQEPLGEPVPATYQGEDGLRAELSWTEQRVFLLWRGRLYHQLQRQGWPGYELRLDWSERLLGQDPPGWSAFEPRLQPYWKFLHGLLHQSQLLDADRQTWEALPVEPEEGQLVLCYDPTESDIRHLLAVRKAEWLQRDKSKLIPLQRACQVWWDSPEVEVELDDFQGPMRVTQQGERRRVFVNPHFPWWKDCSTKEMALRLTLWLQVCSQLSWSEAVRRRRKILEALEVLL